MEAEDEAQLFADLRKLAQDRSREAMRRLGELALGAQSESVMLLAVKELLDRAWGRTTRSADDMAHILAGSDFRWTDRPEHARWDPSRQ